MSKTKAQSDLQKARSLFDAGQWSVIIDILQPHLNDQCVLPEIWYLASLSFLNLNNHELALGAAQQALKRDHSKVDYAIQTLRCMALLGRWRMVGVELDRICARQEDLPSFNAQQYDAVGVIYSICEQHHKAKNCFQHAIDLCGDEPHYFYNLATALRFVGDFDACINACNNAIGLNPIDGQAYALRSEVKKYKPQDNNITELKSAIKLIQDQGQSQSFQEIAVYYSLAKEYDDVGDFKTAFNVLKRAARIRRQQFDYSVQNDVNMMKNIRDLHSKSWLNSHIQSKSPESHRPQKLKGTARATPIFILGLPRSGTSLLERMLAAHSNVSAAGELNDFSRALTNLNRQCGLSSSGYDKSDSLNNSVNLDVDLLGKRYMELCAEKIDEAPMFIDKTPINYLYVGLIRAALPDAKIIILDRNPMDVCLGMFRVNFSQSYPFSYDLGELSQYYLAYRELRDHWVETLGTSAICKVGYEALVENPRGELEKVLKFCGLNWQEKCLDFQNQSQTATTASAYQVRQPIYKSSLNKWKNYQDELGEMFDVFETHGLVI